MSNEAFGGFSLRFFAYIALLSLGLSAELSWAEAELAKADQAPAPSGWQSWLKPTAARTYLRYQKGTMNAVPAASIDPTVSADQVVVWQPNAIPALGVSVDLPLGVSLSWARSVDALRRRDLGSSVVHHFEAHKYWGHFAVDGYYQWYRGFYSDTIPRREIRLIGDGYLRDPQRLKQHEEARLLAYGLAGFYIHDPKAFPSHEIFEARQFEPGFHWTWSVMLSYSRYQFQSNEALIPSEAQTTFPRLSDMRSMAAVSTALAPGLLTYFRWQSWFISAGAFWGLNIADVRVSPDGQEGREIGDFGSVRGGVGWGQESWTAGLAGFKSLVTQHLEGAALSHSLSRFEIFLHYRFDQLR